MVVVIKSTLNIKTLNKALWLWLFVEIFIQDTCCHLVSIVSLLSVFLPHLCWPLSASTCWYLSSSTTTTPTVLTSPPPHQQNLSPLPADALFYLHGRILFLFTAIWLQNALQHDTTTNNLLAIIGETRLDQIKINHLEPKSAVLTNPMALFCPYFEW